MDRKEAEALYTEILQLGIKKQNLGTDIKKAENMIERFFCPCPYHEVSFDSQAGKQNLRVPFVHISDLKVPPCPSLYQFFHLLRAGSSIKERFRILEVL